jgi:toxin ParE1/3/4
VKVVWTKQAQRDIKAIYDYIAYDSEYYAAEVVDAILDAEHRIGEFPTAGGLVRERLRRDVRQVKRYAYRIIYKILSKRIDVLTVVHERRNLVLEE